jgi:hypothetical protein
MIILEGPDGAGKTTLGQKLLDDGVITKLLQSPARTRGRVPLLDQTLRYMRLHRKDHHTAVDRFIFSEMVYGPILRDKCQFSKQNFMSALQELIHSKCPIVFCLPGLENLTFKKDESPFVLNKIGHIYHSYETHYKSISASYTRALRYHWKDPDSYRNLVLKIKEAQL